MLVAAEAEDLAVAQGLLDGGVVGGLQEVVGHHFGQAERDVGGPDVLAHADVLEPALLPLGL